MKKPILFLSLFVFIVSAACNMAAGFDFKTLRGSGEIISESRTIPAFDAVEVCCGMELYLTQGEVEALQIEADDNFMAEIVTSVVENRLEIEYRYMGNISYEPSQPVKIYLTATTLRAVSISGGGYFEAGPIESDGFKLALSGGSEAWISALASNGDVEANVSGGGQLKVDSLAGDQVSLNFSGGSDGEISALSAETLLLDSSGGGMTRIAGKVTRQTITLSGGSGYQAGDLESQHTDLSSSGGGDATVWVNERLAVDLSGDSDLEYYGRPEISDQSLSGDSELDALGEHP